MIPFTVIAATMTFVWPFATSKGALIAISVIYGCVEYNTCVVMAHSLPPPVFLVGPMSLSCLYLPWQWVPLAMSADARGSS